MDDNLLRFCLPPLFVEGSLCGLDFLTSCITLPPHCTKLFVLLNTFANHIIIIRFGNIRLMLFRRQHLDSVLKRANSVLLIRNSIDVILRMLLQFYDF